MMCLHSLHACVMKRGVSPRVKLLAAFVDIRFGLCNPAWRFLQNIVRALYFVAEHRQDTALWQNILGHCILAEPRQGPVFLVHLRPSMVYAAAWLEVHAQCYQGTVQCL